MSNSNKRAHHAAKKKALLEKKKSKQPAAVAEPAPTPLVEQPAQVNQPSELERVIAESRADLAAEHDLPKRGRGRPRKHLEEPAPEAAAPVQPEASPAPTPAASGGALSSTIGTIVKLPFAMRAEKTGFPGYRIDKEIASELGAAWGKVADKYLPNGVSDDPLVNAMLFTGSVILAKEMELAEHREKHAPKPKPQPKVEQPAESKPQEPVFETEAVDAGGLPIAPEQFFQERPSQ